MRSFFYFKDSYFATATAVIINVHFSITCLPLSYSSPSTTLCIITVTHHKSGVGPSGWACMSVKKEACNLVSVCRRAKSACFFVRPCKCVCMSANLPVDACVCERKRVNECVCSLVLWGRGPGWVFCPVSHQKLKPVRLPCFLMEPPDVIAANAHHVIWLSSTLHNPSSVTWPTKSTNHFPPPPLPPYLRHPPLHSTSAPCDVLHR